MARYTLPFIEEVQNEIEEERKLFPAMEDIVNGSIINPQEFEIWKKRKGIIKDDGKRFYDPREDDANAVIREGRHYRFRSYKRYVASSGLSAAFRNMALAPSHCAQNHGYALQFHLTFEAIDLDNNIVVDFGSLKSYLQMLKDNFDHMTLVAANDPDLEMYYLMEKKKMANINILPAIGCEAFAYMAYGALETWLVSNGYSPRVRAVSVEVWEHEANGAAYGRF